MTLSIVQARPRERVQARLSDGRIFEAPPGTALNDILAVAFPDQQRAPVAAILGGVLTELTTPLLADSDVVPVTTADADGMRIYRRSLAFLLVTATAELFPDAHVVIDHSATTAGAYYCWVAGRAPFERHELAAISQRMREIVASDAPFRKTKAATPEAMALFTARGEDDKARLLAHRAKPTLNLYELRSRRDYFQGYMVPSAGRLPLFELHSHLPGFMLQFPHQSRPTELGAIPPYPKLFAVFDEYGRWLERLGIRDVGSLNDAIVADRLPEIALVGEALHEARIARIASEIVAQRDRIKIILIAGPSSSGKTTFSKRLGVQLVANGVRPHPLALDDYFLSRHLTPRDEKGDYDYEHLHALDVGLFNEHLMRLIEGRAVALPRYNFRTGEREHGPTVTIDDEDIIIIEGIHGLNPELVPGVPNDRLYRIYASALTQLNIDRHNRVGTTDCRLIRRIVRDAATRGYDAAATLKRWDSVLAGEKRWIFPYQENSDAVFNSALAHELAVLRALAEPLLLQVQPGTKEHLESRRLLSFLRWFRPAPTSVVPGNSILREFVGGSELESFNFAPLQTKALNGRGSIRE
ncbi:MAG: nucleoside kinase [Vicinamibacterales bacterium]